MRKDPLTLMLMAIFLFVPDSIYAADPLVFLDSSPLSIKLSDSYVTYGSAFLQNNTDSPLAISFVVKAQMADGPMRFEVASPDAASPLEPGEVRAFRLKFYTTSKGRLSTDTNLSSTGYLVAMAENNPGIRTAVRPISFYIEPEALIGYKKFTVPLALTTAVILPVIMYLWLRQRIGSFSLMSEVKFDPKESWLSNFVIGTSILNSIIGFGTLREQVKTEVAALTGLFVLLILIGPIVYNLTLKPGPKEKNVGGVWAFITACAFTLMGSYGALATAFLVLDYFAQTKLISEPVRMFFRVLLGFLVLLISLYAFGAIQRTVVTQAIDVEGNPRSSIKKVRQRSSLL